MERQRVDQERAESDMDRQYNDVINSTERKPNARGQRRSSKMRRNISIQDGNQILMEQSHLQSRAEEGCAQRLFHALQASKFFFLWLLWLLVGSIFYTFHLDMPWERGFYQAVNIGYSIGWGHPIEGSEDVDSRWFSTFYVIIGASFVALALSYFAEKITEDRDNWYENVQQQAKYDEETSADKPFSRRAKAWMQFHFTELREVLFWFVWTMILALISMGHVQWGFDEALYFAVSSCSTGGHWALPNESDNWMFALVGFFAALGVPMMGIAMAAIASFFMDTADQKMEAIKDAIRKPVVADELAMMAAWNMENGDGFVDRTEFVVLCLVRAGIDPALIDFISERFENLDQDHSGTLTREELKLSRRDKISGKVKKVLGGLGLDHVTLHGMRRDADEKHLKAARSLISGIKLVDAEQCSRILVKHYIDLAMVMSLPSSSTMSATFFLVLGVCGADAVTLAEHFRMLIASSSTNRGTPSVTNRESEARFLAAATQLGRSGSLERGPYGNEAFIVSGYTGMEPDYINAHYEADGVDEQGTVLWRNKKNEDVWAYTDDHCCWSVGSTLDMNERLQSNCGYLRSTPHTRNTMPWEVPQWEENHGPEGRWQSSQLTVEHVGERVLQLDSCNDYLDTGWV